MRSIVFIIGIATYAAQAESKGQDCNTNGIPDSREIADGSLMDCDEDGLPDACAAGFPGRKTNVTGQFPGAIISADVNQDGAPDIITSNDDSAQNTGSVLLGDGEGGFRSLIRPYNGGERANLAAVDFTSDGIPDLAIGRNRLEVRTGRGDGTFDFFRPDMAMGSDKGLLSRDFDGDGVADLAAGNSTGVRVALGRGDGTFDAPMLVQASTTAFTAEDLDLDGIVDLALVGFNDPVSVHAGNGDGTFRLLSETVRNFLGDELHASDLNGDGKSDLVMNHSSGWVLSLFSGSGDGTFEFLEDIAFEGNIQAVSVADFDGDGAPDLAAANISSRDVAVLYGRGDLGFGTPIRVANGEEHLSLTTADFNRDGLMDIATPTYWSNYIQVLIARADRTFRDSIPAASVGREPIAMATGDLNRDGRADLVTANLRSNDVSVLLAGRDGFLSFETRLPVGMTPTSLLALDTDRDEVLDLVVANSDDGFSLLMGREDGSFSPEIRILQAGDFDLDGNVDVAAVTDDRDSLIVLPGTGNGEFEPPLILTTNVNSNGILAADIDQDGRMDILSVQGSGVTGFIGNGDGTFGNTIVIQESVRSLHEADVDNDRVLDLCLIMPRGALSVRRGNGDGTFEERVNLPFGRAALDLRSADLDGDGAQDLLSLHDQTQAVCITTGNGDGTFHFQRFVATIGTPSKLVDADFDADGHPDVAVSIPEHDKITVLLGRGDAMLGSGLRYLGVGVDPRAILSADLDDDGHEDIATANPGSHDVAVLRGNGRGGFRNPILVPAGFTPNGVIDADFNQDGRTDLAISRNLGLSVALGAGDGAFPTLYEFPNDAGPEDLFASDMDGDGRSDLVTVNGGNSVSVYLGKGNGTFEAEQRFAAGLLPYQIASGDFNGDGMVDVVTTNHQEIAVLLAIGGGRLRTPPRRIPFVDGSYALAVIDLDTNGVEDLAVAGPNVITMLRGSGTGMFTNWISSMLAVSPFALIPEDFNGDGSLDLGTANGASRDAYVLLGKSDLSFETSRRFPLGGAPTALASADFDEDGSIDLVASLANTALVTVLLNEFPPPDRVAPSLRCPDSIELRCSGPEGAEVDFDVTAEDDCDPFPDLVCDHSPAARFPPGRTLVTCTAVDAAGNSSLECSFEIQVSCDYQLPGDCNQDARLDISDGVCLLRRLFESTDPFPCGTGTPDDSIALLDWNGDGAVDLSDGVSSLAWLFLDDRPHVLGSSCTSLPGCPLTCGQ